MLWIAFAHTRFISGQPCSTVSALMFKIFPTIIPESLVKNISLFTNSLNHNKPIFNSNFKIGHLQLFSGYLPKTGGAWAQLAHLVHLAHLAHWTHLCYLNCLCPYQIYPGQPCSTVSALIFRIFPTIIPESLVKYNSLFTKSPIH